MRILDAGAGAGALFGVRRGNGFGKSSPAFDSCGCIRERSEDIAVLERNNRMVQKPLAKSRYFLSGGNTGGGLIAIRN